MGKALTTLNVLLALGMMFGLALSEPTARQPGPETESDAITPEEPATGNGSADHTALQQKALISAVRAVVRDEMEAASGELSEDREGHTEDDPSEDDPHEPQEFSAAQQAAYANISDASARGSWGPADREELRQLMAEAHEESFHEIIVELARAVNDGDMRADVHGPLI